MKKALFIIPAAAMFILAGCQKAQTTAQSAEPQEQVDDSELIYIGIGGFDSPTKVTADLAGETEVKFTFDVGDIVAFVNENNKSDISKLECIKLITDEEGNVKSAGFTQRSGSKLVEEKKYTICYPASFANFDFSNWKNVWYEKYEEDKLPKEHIIWSPSQQKDQTSFILNTHTSVIHFQVKGTAKINKVEFHEYFISPFGSDYVKRTVLNCGDGVQLNSNTATDFYIDALMIGESISKFKLIFYGEGGQSIGEKESVTETIQKTDKFYDFPEFVL